MPNRAKKWRTSAVSRRLTGPHLLGSGGQVRAQQRQRVRWPGAPGLQGRGRLSAAFRDVAFSNAAGASSTRTGGDFAFPLSAFDSAGEIVVVHDAGEAVKKLDSKDLAKLE